MNREIKQKVKNIIKKAMTDAKSYDDKEVRPEHLINAILVDDNNQCTEILRNYKVDLDEVYDKLSDYLKNVNFTPRIESPSRKLPYSKKTQVIFDNLNDECEKMGGLKIDTSHLMLSILYNKSKGCELLGKYGINYINFKQKVKEMNNEMNNSFGDFEPPQDDRPYKKSKKKGSASVLDNFCRDISKAVEEGRIDPIVGREKEIKRVSQILARRKKNNPVLIGEPGVGKTSVIEGLAQLIHEGKAPRVLLNKKIFSLDLTSIVAGTKYRGQFEERMKVIIEELTNNDEIILFIDELHTLVGSGNSSGSLDGSNILKPSLARGELQVIGATTLDEFREHIETDGALTRRFQQVLVEEPTLEETKTILENIKGKYEDYHKVIYTDDAIEECVKLSDRYISDRAMPDKAIDVLDEAGASTNISVEPPKEIKKLEAKVATLQEEKKSVVKQQKYEEAAKLRDQENKVNIALEDAKKLWIADLDKQRKTVDADIVAEIVSDMTGIPISKISTQESKKLMKMDSELLGKVIGQDEAVTQVVKSVKRNRIGIKDKTKPIGSFIFLGPTGVGKCHGKGTKIMMYNGSIKNVEEIQEGELLMGDDSTPRTVLSLARGQEQMYRITPKRGGDSFTCNESHILSLKNTTTKEIINISIKDYLEKSDWFKHTHKLYRVGVEYDKNDLGIDPYFLGLWLGDGNSKRVGITTADSEIVNYLNEFTMKLNTQPSPVLDYYEEEYQELEEEYKISIHEHVDNKSDTYYISTGMNGGKGSILRSEFQHYCLFDNKHIPFDYLTSDKNDRKALLAGLIDSDGHMFHKSYEIAQKNTKLANDIVRLSRSLGYCAYIKEKMVNDVVYNLVRISGDLSDLPIKLGRKQSEPRKQIKDVLVTSFEIEKLEVDDYYGFTLDGNHLYLLGDFTVTHNTHLAKMMAEYIFGDPEALVRIDMSEYMEKFSVSRLIGPPPGYVGYEEGGQLTEKVRRKPYSVILFDEIEKAHDDVFNLLLQLLDEGTLTDGLGRKVNFKNTLIIMTSNIGVKEVSNFGKNMGFETKSKVGDEEEKKRTIIEKALKKKFKPEFLNRLDDTIIFNSLKEKDISKIIHLELDKLKERVLEMGYEVKVNKSAVDYLVSVGYDEAYGARPLNRAIQNYVENPVSDEILNGKFQEGDTIKVGYDKKTEKITVS